MDKNFKNVLAAVGAVAVVKAAPVLALGAVIGAAATNPDKVAKAKEKVLNHIDMVFAKYGMDVSGEPEPEANETPAEETQEETETFEEPEVNVAPAVEIYDETATPEEEEVNPNEAGNWGAT